MDTNNQTDTGEPKQEQEQEPVISFVEVRFADRQVKLINRGPARLVLGLFHPHTGTLYARLPLDLQKEVTFEAADVLGAPEEGEAPDEAASLGIQQGTFLPAVAKTNRLSLSVDPSDPVDSAILQAKDDSEVAAILAALAQGQDVSAGPQMPLPTTEEFAAAGLEVGAVLEYDPSDPDSVHETANAIRARLGLGPTERHPEDIAPPGWFDQDKDTPQSSEAYAALTDYERQEKRGAVADFNYRYLQEQAPEGSRVACPDCGSVEGADPSWRYVDGHYEHKCPRKHPQVGHYRIAEVFVEKPAIMSGGHNRQVPSPQGGTEEDWMLHTHPSLAPYEKRLHDRLGDTSERKPLRIPDTYPVPFGSKAYEVHDANGEQLGEMWFWFRSTYGRPDPQDPSQAYAVTNPRFVEAGSIFIPRGSKPSFYHDPAVYAAFPNGAYLSPLRPQTREVTEVRTPPGE